MRTLHRLITILASSTCFALAGCSLPSPLAAKVQGVPMNGSVFGGQQPVSGAAIQLYAAGNTGYGSAYSYSAGTSLLGTTTVTSDSGGNFTITGDYTCPSSTTPVYLVATGGNPGLSGNATNPQIAMMTALGPCGSLTPSTAVQINERTTVASVWALSPFMTGLANIGATPTNATGLANAFASVNKLVDTSTGAVPGPYLPANATAPTTKLNTLANILASCINSIGGAAGTAGPCGTLLTATTVNGVAPVDTIGAALNLAQHSNLHTSTLTDLVSTASPFQPTLSNAPADFSLVITYSGNGLAAPKGIAADAQGDIWIVNSNGNSVTKLSNDGFPLSGSGGYTVGSMNSPSGIALDAGGNAWITNTGGNTVSRISSSGTTGLLFSGGAMNTPTGTAIDVTGNVWIANGGSSTLTQITPDGSVTSVSGAGTAPSNAIAINPK